MDSRYLEIILGISSLSSPNFSKRDKLVLFNLSSLLYENRPFYQSPASIRKCPRQDSSIPSSRPEFSRNPVLRHPASRIPHPVPNLAPFYFQVPNSLRGRRLKGEGGIWARERERKVIPFPFPFKRLPCSLGPKGFDRLCSKRQHNMLLAVLVYS